MIVRPKQHWLQLIFVWHGSVLPKIYTRLLLNFLLSIAVILMLPWYTSLGIKFTVAPFSSRCGDRYLSRFPKQRLLFPLR